MIKKIRFKSIRTDMLVCFSALVLLAVGIFVSFSIVYTKSNLKQNSSENNRQLMEQVNVNIENYIDYMDSILRMIMAGDEVSECMRSLGNDKACDELQDRLTPILQVRKDIYNIAVVGDGGCYFVSPDRQLNPYARLEEKEWYRKALRSDDDIMLSSHVQNIVMGEYKWVVTLSRKLEDPLNRETTGLLAVDLNYEVISNLCESVNLGKKGYVYILDENGEIIYHPQQQLILSGVKDEVIKEITNRSGTLLRTDENGEEKLYTSYRSYKTGWTIVGVAYLSESIRNEQIINRIYISLAIILVMLALVLAFLLSQRITRPVKDLQNAMQKIQKDEFEPIYVPAEGTDEIASLRRSFNRMMEYIDELLKMNALRYKEQQQSEMKALQAQINPHFLYNTLDSIIWMVETDDQEQAIRMTSALALFFRQAIGNSNIFVTVNEELEYTRQYLIIQRMRYKDKVDFGIQVNDEIRQYKIVKLILQPLVENSLYHGLKYKKGKGIIKITGYQLEDKIYLKVSDNGIGMDKDTVEGLLDKEKLRSENEKRGIGIHNIQSRIQLYYGREYGLSIESEKGIGTTVTITVPAKEDVI